MADQAMRSRTNGAVILPVAIPIREQRAPWRYGLLVAGLKPDRLLTVWDRLPLPPGSDVMLVDNR
jgi:hypothetical protein